MFVIVSLNFEIASWGEIQRENGSVTSIYDKAMCGIGIAGFDQLCYEWMSKIWFLKGNRDFVKNLNYAILHFCINTNFF